ncbi:MAG: hypothetical protein IPM51_16785 [Sphingobacteriaceae bacterium]|nr:hypothetical protein [Sphingobacteriaceae bacterium]
MKTKSIALLIVLISLKTTKAQISNLYPNDIGIQTNSNVIFTEMFEESSVSTLTLSGNWDQATTVTNNIVFDSSVPATSTGSQSLRLRTVDDGTNLNENTFIYKKIQPDILDSVFVRFYIKYDNATVYHHSGVYIGGKNPPSSTAGLVGGVLVQGNQEFHVGAEIRGLANNTATNTSTFGFYNYWMNMKPSAITNTLTNQPFYYGNQFLNSTTSDDINMSTWNCIEVMVKLNNPVTSYNGEQALWVNGIKINHYGYNFPTGTWNYGNFTEGTGNPFEGFQWRNDMALNLNYIWLKNFNDNNGPGHVGNIYFDHLVVAKSYIGPIAVPNGIQMNSEENQRLKIFPIPSSELINFSEKVNAFDIYNVYGEKIFTQSIPSGSFSTANLKDGIYFMRASNSIQKFVVKH